MCLLILLHGIDPRYPIVVANNRDEARDRPAAPPGLFVGSRRRILSPRDRRAHGTWCGINDLGLFAGLTNLVGPAEPDPVATTRGELPHLALDEDTVDGAVDAVQRRVAGEPFKNFQLVVADADDAAVIVHEAGRTHVERPGSSLLVLSNEHRLGALALPDAAALVEPGIELEARFDRLRDVLCDEGERSGHRILKKGGPYGTVASSLLAVGTEPRDLVWRYAAGEPDATAFRNYGNLGRRLQG